jgi:hypothetical protein
MANIMFSAINKHLSTRKPIVRRKYNFVKRKQKDFSQLLFAKFLNLENISKKMHHHSCKRNCFSTISADIVLSICHQYIPKDTLDKNEWIRNYLQFNQVIIGNNTNIRWNLDRYDICKQCWMVATTVTKYKLKNCWKTENSSTGTKKISAKLSSLVAWLGSYFDDVCD